MTDMTDIDREENARNRADAMGLTLCGSLTDETWMLVDQKEGTIECDGLDLEGVEDRLDWFELQKDYRELRERYADIKKRTEPVLASIDEISALKRNHPRSVVRMDSLLHIAIQDADALREALEKARA